MSGSLSSTLAATPTTVQVTASMIALMAGLTGVPTDYNDGSQVRTLNEAMGSVVEVQAVSDLALAFQALTYGAMSLFGVTPSVSLPATGIVTFATSFPVATALPAPQAVTIPANTLVQTSGGTQFATLSAATLASGVSNVMVGVIATIAGAAGNVPASGISGTPLTGIGYPLFVSNGVATAGGADPGTQSSALAQFTARQASLGLASPVAVANSPVGVTVSGTGETVAFAACYEPFLAAGSGAGSGTAGFVVYVDNGAGNSTAALLAAVNAWISGSITANQSGFRPIGVPYQVLAATPIYAAVVVSGTLTPGLLSSSSLSAAVTSGVTNYFNTLGISAPQPGTSGLNSAGQPQIAGVVADAGLGAFSSLSVNLYYYGASGSVPLVSGGVGTRVILSSLSVNVGSA